MTMTTLGVTGGAIVEIISAYAACNQQVPSATVAPAWHVIGAFYMPVQSDVKVEAIGSVSAGTVTMSVRLFDVTNGVPVDGSQVDITSTTDVRALSGAFTLPGGLVYQFQAQAIGPASNTGFARSAALLKS